jgi:hypothetical protein
MSAKSELYDALNADAALAALVEERIYPDAVPQGVALPAVVYTAQAFPEYGLDSSVLAERTAFTIGCWGATRASADAVAAAVKAVLAGLDLTPAGPQDAYDPEVGAYSSTLEVDFWT